MTAGEAVVAALACFAAGLLNAAAGGGSLVSFPALVGVGLSPLAANVTNTLAIWPGYVGGAASLAGNVRRSGTQLRPFAVAAVVGAVVGSIALLASAPDAFEAVVPLLVLLAAALLAVPSRWLERLRRAETARGHGPVAVVGVGLGAVYGAYFGGGLGVMLLAVLNAFVGADLRNLNAVKNVLTLLINTVALVAFVGFGPVDWTVVAVGAPASLVGGLTGGRASAHVDPKVLRWGVVIYATVAAAVLAVT